MHSRSNKPIHENKAQTKAYSCQTKSDGTEGGPTSGPFHPEKPWLNSLSVLGQTQVHAQEVSGCGVRGATGHGAMAGSSTDPGGNLEETPPSPPCLENLKIPQHTA